MKITPAELVANNQSIEPSWAHLRQEFALSVRHRLCAQLRRKMDESEIVQESMLDLLRSVATIRGTSVAELSAWIRVVVKHNLLDA
jgi:DNA-directed RNA polymerase specialized sigma24 family protein